MIAELRFTQKELEHEIPFTVFDMLDIISENKSDSLQKHISELKGLLMNQSPEEEKISSHLTRMVNKGEIEIAQ